MQVLVFTTPGVSFLGTLLQSSESAILIYQSSKLCMCTQLLFFQLQHPCSLLLGLLTKLITNYICLLELSCFAALFTLPHSKNLTRCLSSSTRSRLVLELVSYFSFPLFAAGHSSQLLSQSLEAGLLDGQVQLLCIMLKLPFLCLIPTERSPQLGFLTVRHQTSTSHQTLPKLLVSLTCSGGFQLLHYALCCLEFHGSGLIDVLQSQK